MSHLYKTVKTSSCLKKLDIQGHLNQVPITNGSIIQNNFNYLTIRHSGHSQSFSATKNCHCTTSLNIELTFPNGSGTQNACGHLTNVWIAI